MTNWELLRWADYSRSGRIKALLLRMDNLLSLAERGDAVAHSIYIDMKNALYTEGVLSVKQRKYLLLWMAGYEQNQIGWMFNVAHNTVSIGISLGVRNISNFLEKQ